VNAFRKHLRVDASEESQHAYPAGADPGYAIEKQDDDDKCGNQQTDQFEERIAVGVDDFAGIDSHFRFSSW
jgi:hypothetical protein